MRMRKKDRMKILLVSVVAFVLVIIIAVVIFLLKSLKTLDSLSLSPDFVDTELDVNQDYTFSLDASPSRANIKSLEYVVDDPTATLNKGENENTVVLHTGAEGSLTVYVKKSKVESNHLTFQVVDMTKRAEEQAAAAAEAEAQAAAEAAAQAEAMEAAEESVEYAMVTKESVRMRAEPNTDCEIVRTCDIGEAYPRIEEVDDWTKVDFEGRECYIKTEFIKIVSEEEANTAKAELEADAETKKVEEEAEKKKAEEKKSNRRKN